MWVLGAGTTGTGPGCLFGTRAKPYPTRGNPRVILELHVSTVLSICYNLVLIYLSVFTGLASTVAREGDNRDIGSQCDPMLHSENDDDDDTRRRTTTATRRDGKWLGGWCVHLPATGAFSSFRPGKD